MTSQSRIKGPIKAFVDYVELFMENNRLFPQSGKAIVAVSGGMDSMALLAFLKEIQKRKRIKSIEVLHVNHGTRQENIQEERLVKKYSSFLGPKCRVLSPQLSLKGVSNFEEMARKERYRLFSTYVGPGDFLYMGHHLDDSFEWSLMQQLRSSEAKSSLGIPLVAGNVVRPFLSVTRRQIKSFVNDLGIPFLEDSSNRELQYERNYIRHSVIPQLEKKWPQYLKHYAFRSNHLAKVLGVHRVQRKGSLTIIKDSYGGVLLLRTPFNKDFNGFEEEIKEEIKKLSGKKRGTLSLQVQKTCDAAKKNKFGPMLYSGKVWGYLFPGLIYLATEKVKNKWDRLDAEMAENLEICLKSQKVPEKSGFLAKKDIFSESPLVFFNKNTQKKGHFLKSLNRVHPLLPRTTGLALEGGIGFQSLGLVRDSKGKFGVDFLNFGPSSAH